MPSSLKLQVTLVRNPSLIIERTMITLKNEQFPEFYELFIKIQAICHEQPFRIYWRVSEQEYMSIYSFISLKGGLNLMYTMRIYVVMDEAIEVAQCKIQSSVNLQHKYASPRRERSEEINSSCNLDSLLRSPNISSVYEMSDIEVLQRALLEIESPDDPQAAFNHFFAKTPIPHTCEWKEVDRQFKILMKNELNRINRKL